MGQQSRWASRRPKAGGLKSNFENSSVHLGGHGTIHETSRIGRISIDIDAGSLLVDSGIVQLIEDEKV
jgi:hypothetical protein